MCNKFIFHARFTTSLSPFSVCASFLCPFSRMHAPSTVHAPSHISHVTSSLQPGHRHMQVAIVPPTHDVQAQACIAYACMHVYIVYNNTIIVTHNRRPSARFIIALFSISSPAHRCIPVINIFSGCCWSKHIHFIRTTSPLCRNKRIYTGHINTHSWYLSQSTAPGFRINECRRLSSRAYCPSLWARPTDHMNIIAFEMPHCGHICTGRLLAAHNRRYSYKFACAGILNIIFFLIVFFLPSLILPCCFFSRYRNALFSFL